MSGDTLVLSLFPGIGLLDMAFEQEGFCVVRGPDCLWGGDIRRFRPSAGVFAGVIGGPPCQAFSRLAHLVRANGHEPRFGNLIPEFERCVLEAAPAWFLVENVPAAPIPFGGFKAAGLVEALIEPRRRDGGGYGLNTFLLDNSALDSGDGYGQEQQRVRRWTFGVRGREAPNLMRWIDLATFLLPDAGRTLTQFPVDNSQEAKRRVPAENGGHSDPNESLTAARRLRKTVVSAPGLEIVGKHGKAKRQEIAAQKQRVRRQAVLSDPSAVPVKIGGSGKVKRTVRAGTVTSSDGGGGGMRPMSRYRFAEALRLQGLPEDFLADAPFTSQGKLKAVANGVPLPMGRAVARAVKEAVAAAEKP